MGKEDAAPLLYPTTTIPGVQHTGHVLRLDPGHRDVGLNDKDIGISAALHLGGPEPAELHRHLTSVVENCSFRDHVKSYGGIIVSAILILQTVFLNEILHHQPYIQNHLLTFHIVHHHWSPLYQQDLHREPVCRK